MVVAQIVAQYITFIAILTFTYVFFLYCWQATAKISFMYFMKLQSFVTFL